MHAWRARFYYTYSKTNEIKCLYIPASFISIQHDKINIASGARQTCICRSSSQSYWYYLPSLEIHAVDSFENGLFDMWWFKDRCFQFICVYERMWHYYINLKICIWNAAHKRKWQHVPNGQCTFNSQVTFTYFFGRIVENIWRCQSAYLFWSVYQN